MTNHARSHYVLTPFDDYIDIDIGTRDTHPTLGLKFQDNIELGHRLQLVNFSNSTPAACIPRWCSTLRHSFPISIGNTTISSLDDIRKDIRTARTNKDESVTCRLRVIENTAMHPQNGVPILFHDQLNVISEHLQSIKLSMDELNEKHRKYLDAILPKVHTLTSRKKRAKLIHKILKQ